MGDGIPIRLLHEAVPHVVTVETRTGDSYRGTLSAAEDNMNVQLKRAVRTRPDGRVQALDHVFIRGSTVRLLVLPDILASAPMFKRVVALKEGRHAEARGLGRGRGFAATGRGAPVGGAMGGAGRGAGRGAPLAGGGRGAPRY
jgi:small nuclear ribonucleoprotein D3